MILNPIVEINDVAVDTWKTFLVTFNTPWYNTHQSCSAINVADKRATRITLACIFARWGNWSTTLIERRLICMRKASANLILINPETVVREQTLKTFSFDSNLSWSQKWTVIWRTWSIFRGDNKREKLSVQILSQNPMHILARAIVSLVD